MVQRTNLSSRWLNLKSDFLSLISALYNEWAQSLERKPYPSMEAMSNVFQLALRRNPEIADYNPVAMWDAHHVRELDNSGYIDKLYK